MRSRPSYFARAAVVLGLAGCMRHRATHPLSLANPGATFEVELAGCATTGQAGRRFGADARTAVLWSRERVHTASYLPCTATIVAKCPSEQRRAVYRVSRTRDGAFVEELLPARP